MFAPEVAVSVGKKPVFSKEALFSAWASEIFETKIPKLFSKVSDSACSGVKSSWADTDPRVNAAMKKNLNFIL